MAEFLIVRHASDVDKSHLLQYIYGSVDTYLSREGHVEGGQLAEGLAQTEDIIAVHAPPLLRTLGTARYICRRAERPLIHDVTLVGRNMGYFALRGHTSMAAAATKTIYNSQGVPYFVEVPGAESLDAFYARMQASYTGLVESYADQKGSVVLVTQHFAGTLLRGAHDGLPLRETIEYGDLAHTGVARLSPGELSVELQPGQPVYASVVL